MAELTTVWGVCLLGELGAKAQVFSKQMCWFIKFGAGLVSVLLISLRMSLLFWFLDLVDCAVLGFHS